MLIPDLTLTPGLADRLRKCGDERRTYLIVIDTTGGVLVLHEGGVDLAEHEQRRVEGVITAHRVKAF